MTDEYSAILSVPYARMHESINSPRYQWDCLGRGKEPFVIFQQTLEGAGCFSIDGRTYEVPAGSAFVSMVPEEARYFYPPDGRKPWVFCWLNFYGALGVELWRRMREQFGPVIHIPPDSAVIAQLTRLARKIRERKFTDRYEAGAEAYAFYMNYWREAAQPLRAHSDPVAEAVQTCRNHFRDPISVKELAAQCKLSREHFSRIFKESEGISPAAYLRKQRLEAAAEMLPLSRIPLEEVALRTGFYSARHLMKAFGRAYGKTPQQYRREGHSPSKKQ